MPRPSVAAETEQERISSAFLLYFNGKASSARQQLIAELDRPAARAPLQRLVILEALLDLCAHSYAYDCLVKYVPQYVETAVKAAPADPAIRGQLALKAGYYIDYTTAGAGSPEMKAAIFESEGWGRESAADPVLYLRRQALAANVLLEQDRYKDAGARVDKTLSLVASLRNPQDSAYYVAYALAEAMATLLAAGQTERAYGLYVASGAFIVRTLPPLTADAVIFRLAEAQLLQETGRVGASSTAIDAAIGSLAQMELEPGLADGLGGRAHTLKAAVCVLVSDTACAQAALAGHPYAARFARARQPANFEEVGYLAARALVGATSGAPDPAVEAALQASVALDGGGLESLAEVYRRAGLALAMPAGAARAQALRDLGPALLAYVDKEPAAAFGAWRRVGAIEQLLIVLALGQPSPEGNDAANAFGLMQLAARAGPSFDADAFSLLGQARDDLQRRAVHQGLRLKARRESQERDALRRIAAAAVGPPGAAPLTYDVATRGTFGDFADRIDQTDKALIADGIDTSGANLVSLAQFQSVLGPTEAALSVVPLAGDVVAYMCVRKDAVLRSVARADLARAQIDARVIRAGLTAGHAPSEALDSQFPVEAAVRLYDVLIRPFGQCLKPGDRIIWLPNLSAFALPLSVLLEKAPPRTGQGYDLAAADWLVRRHAVSYAGSASLVVAARSGRGGVGADFDFLGVGDPVLTATAAAGGVDFSSLAPLPETKAELEQSAEGFRHAKLLVQDGATERAFRGQLVGSYRHLSFATHGLLREDLPGVIEPALVLTPGVVGDPADDGLLTASEIADLNLAARFVALSACNTANYDLSQFAQDLPALASAFAVAGVPATLATLWPVESETSKQVTAQTFVNLRVGEAINAADAMAQAQRAFLAAPPGKAWLHPRFWAPFVLLGDGVSRPDAPSMRLVEVETSAKAVTEPPRLSARVDAAGLHVAAVRPDGALEPLFTTPASAGAAPSKVSVAPMGDDILLAYAEAAEGRGAPAVHEVGDYDRRLCPTPPSALLELRDRRTGELRASSKFPGHLVTAITPLSGGRALIGGAVTTDCHAGRRAVVFEVDRTLKARVVFHDSALGDSEVRALAPIDGGLLVAAAKENRLDPQRSAGGRSNLYSGMVVRVGADGTASAPKMLDAGSDVLLDSIAAGPGRAVLVSGSVGGQAARFEISTP